MLLNLNVRKNTFTDLKHLTAVPSVHRGSLHEDQHSPESLDHPTSTSAVLLTLLEMEYPCCLSIGTDGRGESFLFLHHRNNFSRQLTWRCCARSASLGAGGRRSSCSTNLSCSMFIIRGGNIASVGRIVARSSKKVDMSVERTNQFWPPVSRHLSRVNLPIKWFKGRKPIMMVGSSGASVGIEFCVE